MKTLFEALSETVRILTPHATPDERRAFASKLMGARDGKEIENIAFRFVDIGRLFHPDDDTAAARLARELQTAREAGELQSIIPTCQGHILPTDLLTWPPCPPVTPDNPLSYWLPVSATTSTTSIAGSTGEGTGHAPIRLSKTNGRPRTAKEIKAAFPKAKWGDKLQKCTSGRYAWLKDTWARVGNQRPGDATTFFPVKVCAGAVANGFLTLGECDRAFRESFPDWDVEWQEASEILRN